MERQRGERRQRWKRAEEEKEEEEEGRKGARERVGGEVGFAGWVLGGSGRSSDRAGQREAN